MLTSGRVIRKIGATLWAAFALVGIAVFLLDIAKTVGCFAR